MLQIAVDQWDEHRDPKREGNPMKNTESVIHSDPEIMSGTPVFVGTRVPFQTLLDSLEAGRPLGEFFDDFPTVNRDQAVAALEQAKEALCLKHELVGQDAGTVPEMGWASKRNGELLALAAAEFDVFLTVDRNLSYQQDVSVFDIAAIVLVSPIGRFNCCGRTGVRRRAERTERPISFNASGISVSETVAFAGPLSFAVDVPSLFARLRESEHDRRQAAEVAARLASYSTYQIAGAMF